MSVPMIKPSEPSPESSENAGDKNKSPCNPRRLRVAVQQTAPDQAKNGEQKAVDEDFHLWGLVSEIDDYGLQLLLPGAAIGFIFRIIFCANLEEMMIFFPLVYNW
jgi:hypothetical protein